MGGADFKPGWLSDICRDAYIRSMADHGPAFYRHLHEVQTPIPAEDAEELRAFMSARFKEWTGKDLAL